MIEPWMSDVLDLSWNTIVAWAVVAPTVAWVLIARREVDVERDIVFACAVGLLRAPAVLAGHGLAVLPVWGFLVSFLLRAPRGEEVAIALGSAVVWGAAWFFGAQAITRVRARFRSVQVPNPHHRRE